MKSPLNGRFVQNFYICLLFGTLTPLLAIAQIQEPRPQAPSSTIPSRQQIPERPRGTQTTNSELRGSSLADLLKSRPSLKERLLNPPTSPETVKKGGIGDGGGSGVICFDSYSFDQSQKALDTDGRLKDSYRSQIRTVWVTDLFEMLQGPHSGSFNYVHPTETENFETYIQRLIKEHLGKYSPRFASLLDAKMQLIPFTQWEAHPEGLPFVDDIGRTENIIATLDRIKHFCSFSQIARRKFIDAGVEKKPIIEYDPLLFDYLSKNEALQSKGFDIQRAMLYFHEVIYLYLNDLGHQDSILTRYITPYLMSSNFTKLVRNPSPTNFDLLYFLDRLGLMDINFFRIKMEPPFTRQHIYLQTLLDVFERLGRTDPENQFIQGIHYRGSDIFKLYSLSELKHLDPAASFFLYGLIRSAQKNQDLFLVERNSFEMDMDASPRRPYSEDMMSPIPAVQQSIERETCQSLKRDLKVSNQEFTKYIYATILRSSKIFADTYHYASSEEMRSLLENGAKACR